MSAPRPAPLASRSDKRKHVRRDVIGSQLLSVDVDAQRASALILDASEGGMALQLATPLKSRSKGTFAFSPPDQTARLRLTGVPVWTVGDRVGIWFPDLDQRTLSSLNQWLASLPPVRTPGPVAVPDPPPHDEPDRPVVVSSRPEPPLDAPNPPPTPGQESLDSMVSRARILLCGTGAAVAWGRPDGMFCRASDGNAPPQGVPVDISRGLSGECVRTGAVVRCDDTECDPRVDPEVCRQLRLRSAIIVPITGASGILGLLEVFSDKPRAFSERDIPTLRTLASQFKPPGRRRQVPLDAALSACTVAPPPSARVSPASAPAAYPMPPAVPRAATAPSSTASAATQPPIPGVSPKAPTREPDDRPKPFQVEALRRTLSSSADEDERKPTPKAMVAALIIAGGVLAGSIYWGAKKVSPSTSKAPQTTSATQLSDNAVNLPQTTAQPAPRTSSSRRASTARRSQTNAPTPGSSAAGLTDSPSTTRATDEDAEEVVTRSARPSEVSDPEQTEPPALAVTPPISDGESNVLASLPSTAVPALSHDVRVSRVSELKLVRQVAPKYPQSALLTRKQGAVMLRLTVGSNGRVKDAHVLSGDEDLARAALDAVREWRYQPYRLNGKPVDVNTDAIITFSITGTSNQ